jgi:hypothetical protein
MVLRGKDILFIWFNFGVRESDLTSYPFCLPSSGLIHDLAMSKYTITLYFWWYWIFFPQCWDLNSGPTPWATPPALFFFFFEGFFWDRVFQTICSGWLQTVILLISASWVARITSVSHQCPAGGIGFWTQGCLLARQVLYCFWHATSPYNNTFLLAKITDPGGGTWA